MELIRGVIRSYDWGDHHTIAELLGHPETGRPEAEYWLGAHSSAPSVLVDKRTLDEFITEQAEHVIGPTVAKRFAGLPFLLKVLAAERPLSIQAHPSSEQAKIGFAAEEVAGIDRAAPNRSYRDDNHKPELICALTSFEAKCGFRPVAECQRLLKLLDAPGLQRLADKLAVAKPAEQVLADTVAWLLRLPANEAAACANAAREAAEARGATGDVDATPESAVEFSIELEWLVYIANTFPGDIGVVVGLLLNHVSLAPGQAIFLQAGNLHSYLRGVGIELMANSDNVLRGGLTSKHIDVEQLLGVVDYRPSAAPIQSPSGAVHRYRSPIPEFSLTRLDSTGSEIGSPSFEPIGPEIILVTSGAVALASVDGSLDVPTGGAALISHGDGRYHVTDRDPGRTVLWRATVGAELEA